MTTNQSTMETAQQLKWKEIQVQQVKLTKLQADLEKLNTKITTHEKLSEDDIHYLGDLGWLAALAVSIAAVAAAV
jgi:hypothetical protein